MSSTPALPVVGDTTPPATPVVPPVKPIVVAPVVPPVVTPQDDATKKYSDLYNQNKDLTEKVAVLTKQMEQQSDTGKNSEQLMQELNTQRTAADDSKTKLDAFNTDMKDMVKKAEEGLTEDQKKMLEFSSEDPFKRLQFINNMKLTSGGVAPVVTPTVTSQGGGVSDASGDVIDLDGILEKAAKGDMKAYKEAKKKHGAEEVKKYIAARTLQPAPVFDKK